MCLSLLGFSSCNCSNWADLNPDEFLEVISSAETCVIDVRTPQEYDEGHLLNAINIDWQKDGFIDEISKKIDKSVRLAIYCRSGRRSAAAASVLSEAGYQVVNLKEGYIS